MAPNRSMSPADVAQGPSVGSPPPLSKRDKRRTALFDKLNHMIKNFNQNLRPHYEAQLNALQVDINLIMRANPYQNQPLPDSAAEIEQTVHKLFGGQLPVDPSAEQDFVATVGKLYAEFAIHVNDLQQEKDEAIAVTAVSLHARGRNVLSREYRMLTRCSSARTSIMRPSTSLTESTGSTSR